MLIGAICGFVVAVTPATRRSWAWSAPPRRARRWRCCSAFSCSASSNQVATGLALTIFGLGLSSLLGLSYTDRARRVRLAFPPLSRHPVMGRSCSAITPIVYSLALVTAVGWFLNPPARA